MKHEPRPTVHMEMQLGWAHKLGEAESLGISMEGQTVLCKFMQSPIMHLLAVSGSVAGGFRKGTIASAHLDV